MCLLHVILWSGCSGSDDGKADLDSATQSDSASEPTDSAPPQDSDPPQETGETGGEETAPPTDTEDSGEPSDPLLDENLAMLTAMEALRASFDADLIAQMDYELGTDEQYDWSNLPVGGYARNGVPYADMTEKQKALAEAVVQASMSADGYGEAAGVRQMDQQMEDAGASNMWGDGYYFIVFDTPDADAPWGWQYEGHHMALNFTMQGDRLSYTPWFMGIAPTTWTGDDAYKGLTPLGQMTDAVGAFHASLSADQQEAANFDVDVPSDIIYGPGADDPLDEYLGTSASTLDSDQQALLLDLIAAWVLDGLDAHSAIWMSEIEAAIDEVTFTWAGEPDSPENISRRSYYRISAPFVLVEYDASDPYHIHAVLRDPRSDYGRDILAEHKRTAH